ncbi:MAG: hypothetical protein ACRCZZ_08235 [Phocaeicola sp.]
MSNKQSDSGCEACPKESGSVLRRLIKLTRQQNLSAVFTDY